MKFLEGDSRSKVREVCEINGKNKCSPTPSVKEDIDSLSISDIESKMEGEFSQNEF